MPDASATQRVAAMRVEYSDAPLREETLAPTWLAQFERWFADVGAAELHEPNAMVLATADAGGRPSARFVLLKGLDVRGFVFYTNLESAKGRELEANPRAELVFPWHPIQRQVRVNGTVEPVTDAEADAYWATRPRGSQLGALASPQSSVIGPDALAAALAEAEAAHPDAVPRPPHWTGRRVVPESVEFWQGRRSRLHDRLRFRRDGEAWVIERLAP